MKRLLSALLAVLITAVCLWFLLTPDVLHSLGRVVADARPLPILVAFLLVGLVQWLRAWRFAMLMTGRLTLPEAGLVRIAFELNFLNFVLPFRLGELSFPILMRHRYGHSLLHTTGVLLLARLFDLANVACILLTAAVALNAAPGVGNRLLAVGAVLAGLAPLALALCGQWIRPYLAMMPHVGGIAERLSAGLEALRGLPVLLATIAVGFTIWLTLALTSILIANAVVATVPPMVAVLGGAASSVAFALPVNGIAGLGPPQAAWVAATVQAGVPWDDAVVSALAQHAVVLVNAVVLGGLAMLAWPSRKPA